MSGQRALITGATGFIGRHLVGALIDANTPVVALTRPGSRVPDQWRGRVTCIECADWNEAGLRAALASQPFERSHIRGRRSCRSARVPLRITVISCCPRSASAAVAPSSSDARAPVDTQNATSARSRC